MSDAESAGLKMPTGWCKEPLFQLQRALQNLRTGLAQGVLSPSCYSQERSTSFVVPNVFARIDPGLGCSDLSPCL